MSYRGCLWWVGLVVAPELLLSLRKLELSSVKGRAPGSSSTPGILWFPPNAVLIPANSKESSRLTASLSE